MDAELKLINVMQVAAGRHADLKTAFRKFRGAAREAFASNVRYSQVAVPLGEIVDQHRFSIEFSGRTIWLVLSLRLDETETAIGQVGCFMQKVEGGAALASLGRFTLNKMGDTNLDKPDHSGEKINVFEPAGAAYVVLHCLRLALRKDWE